MVNSIIIVQCYILLYSIKLVKTDQYAKTNPKLIFYYGI